MPGHPRFPNAEAWHSRMVRRCTLVTEEGGQVIAFAELERDGPLMRSAARTQSDAASVGC